MTEDVGLYDCKGKKLFDCNKNVNYTNNIIEQLALHRIMKISWDPRGNLYYEYRWHKRMKTTLAANM